MKNITDKTLNSWIDCSFTKFNIFKLTEYDKVIFIDADMIALSNIDHLFEYDTPALTLFGKIMRFNDEKIAETGDKIESSIILSNIRDIVACNA